MSETGEEKPEAGGTANAPIRSRPKRKPKKPDEEDSQSIQFGNKNLNLKLDLNGKGIVLVYAIAAAIIMISIGWLSVQLVTALRIALTPIGPTLGFVLWGTIAFISALASR